MNITSMDRDRLEKRGIFYGWFVLAGIFLITAVTCGAFYSFGVFFVPIMSEFGWARGTTSGAVFASGIAYAASVPLIGTAADRYNFNLVAVVAAGIMGLGFFLGSRIQSVWQLYLFAGILPGIGACAAIPLPISLITRWFNQRQGMALGIASAGIGTGAGLVPLLTAYLIANFGWRTAFVVIGVMIWSTYIPVVLLVIRKPDPDYVRSFDGEESPRAVVDASAGGDRGITLVQAAGTTQFWLLFVVFALCILCLGVVMTHVVAFALDSGLTALKAASILTVSGMCSIAGRLAAGIVSDRISAKTVLIFGLALQGLTIFWLSKADSIWMFYTFAVLFGVSYGANLVMIPKLTASVFGAKSMGSVYGGLSVGDGLGFAMGSLLAGYVFDLFGSYTVSFVLIALGLLLTVFLTARIKVKRG
ncbi:MAG: MFS transporter [Proteobacteria bacterium]|nr:MFS transporter [Pseudomonadota bacterium]